MTDASTATMRFFETKAEVIRLSRPTNDAAYIDALMKMIEATYELGALSVRSQ